MSVASRYRQAWEGFWREAPDEPGGVFWDADPKVTAALHLALFEPHLVDAELALVDLGCGNGTQTRYFADRFPRVIGADLSAAALDHARRADPAQRAGYRELDAAEKGAAEALHAELGDANVYVRGVLHSCEPADRQPLVNGIAALAGSAAGSSSSSCRRPRVPSSARWRRVRPVRRRSSRPSSGTASPPARSPTTRCPSICGTPGSWCWRRANCPSSPPSSRTKAPGSSCRPGGWWPPGACDRLHMATASRAVTSPPWAVSGGEEHTETPKRSC